MSANMMISGKMITFGAILALPAIIVGAFLTRGNSPDNTPLQRLRSDRAIDISVPLGQWEQAYAFLADDVIPMTLTLDSQSPNLPLNAEIRKGDTIVATVDGDSVQHAAFTIVPNSGFYQLHLQANNHLAPGSIHLAYDSGILPDTAPLSVQDIPPGTQTDPGLAGGECRFNSGANSVNVLTEPRLGAAVLGVLSPEAFLPVHTMTNNRAYGVETNVGTGWVFAADGTLSGNCINLPFIAIDAVGGVTPQTIPQPTPCQLRNNNNTLRVNVRSTPNLNASIISYLNPGAVMNPVVQSGDGWYGVDINGQRAWISGTVVAQSGDCASLPIEAPPPPVAPPDVPIHLIEFDRDESGQFSDVISYPAGDREDRIQLNIVNLALRPPNNYREFSLTLICDGPGSEFVRWGLPQNPTLTCGSTVTLPFINGANSEVFSIIMPEGSGPAFVAYTLLTNPVL